MTTWNAVSTWHTFTNPAAFTTDLANLLVLVNTAAAGAGLFPAERITADEQPMLEPAADGLETGWLGRRSQG
jgi:hypothetical protein